MMFNSPFVGKGGSTPPKGFSNMEKVVNMVNETLRKELNKIECTAELHEVYDYLKIIQHKIIVQTSLAFNVGDTVNFDSRDGTRIQGIITKVNQKTIKVTSSTGVKWKVSPNLLRKVN